MGDVVVTQEDELRRTIERKWNRIEAGTGIVRVDDATEAHFIGVRDGFEEAVQFIDLLTGGDGEYRFCTDADPERHCPTPVEMVLRIVSRAAQARKQMQEEAAKVAENFATARWSGGIIASAIRAIGDKP